MGAAVVGEILRFRPWRRGRPASLLLILVTAGLTGSVVLADRPARKGRESQAGGAGLARAFKASHEEMASPPPHPPPSPPRPAVPAAPPPDPGGSRSEGGAV